MPLARPLVRRLSRPLVHGLQPMSAAARLAAYNPDNAFALGISDNSLIIKDAGTPANSFGGVFYTGSGYNKLTVTGALLPSAGGALFNAANFASIATTLFPYSATAGTLYVKAIQNSAAAITKAMAELHDGTAAERIGLYTFTEQPTTAVVDNNVSQAGIAGSATATVGTPFKFALAWAVNDFQIAHNGALGTADTLGTLPTLTTLSLGIRAASANPFNGYLLEVLYVPVRLPNATLQAMTA